MENIELSNLAKRILKNNGMGENIPCKKIRSGFNRTVFDIDNKYILKICYNVKREDDVKNEMKFFLENNYDFCPSLILFDSSKRVIPYIYTIEEKINGELLFHLWGTMSGRERENVLSKLVYALRIIHSKPVDKTYNPLTIIDSFNMELGKCESKQLFSINDLDYLKKLRDSFKEYL